MSGWWEEMFELPAWQAVQLGWEALEDADHHVDLIVRATGSRAGMRVLDVPCGTGRIAKRLAERGLDVVGVDLTDRFLDEARAAGLVVERADMRELPFEDTFDVAICMWGSFGYFDDAGNLVGPLPGQARGERVGRQIGEIEMAVGGHHLHVHWVSSRPPDPTP